MDSTQRTRPRTGGSPVGLVIFIILTVVFAVLAYWSFAKFQSAADEVTKTKGSLTAAQQAQAKADDTVAQFQKATGVDAPDAMKEFVKNVLDATKAEGYGASAQDTAKDALTTALQTISQLKIALDSVNSNYTAEVAAHKSLDEQKKAGDGAYKKDVDDKTAEIQALQKQMADQRRDSDAKIDQEVGARDALRIAYYTEQDKWKETEVKYIIHVAELQQRLRELSGEGAVLEKASGYITAIDISNNLATVNIGKSSGVRPGMRFVAFSRDPAGKPVKKGVIEITKVDERVSVGRVVVTERGMAVGKNDYVYNVAGPTAKLFVFAGAPKLYLIEQWTNFIRANGGEVVQSVRNGDQVADYLVLSYKAPTEEAKPEEPEMAKMIVDARDFGLRIIKEQDLKSAMGLK